MPRTPFEEIAPVSAEASPSLSSRFFNDPGLRAGYSEFSWRPMAMPSPEQNIVMDNPYGNFGDTTGGPLLSPEIKPHLAGASKLDFTSPADNEANGETPDFRLVKGTDGQLRLEPTGEGDPLADGKLNIETDPGDKSLQEAIKNADENMKEYIREMMQYWQQNHPGQPFPSWWNDILNSRPNIPGDSKPVPVEQTPPQHRPQPRQSSQPPAAPSEGWQPDYRGGGGRGYNGGGGGGGGNSGGGGGRRRSGGDGSYYRGGDGSTSSPSYEMPGTVPDFKDSTGFIDKLVKTLMANEGALNQDGTPKFTAYNADDNGGISVGLRQWHAGGALPELLNAWKDKNPEKYQEYFKGYSPAQINGMSSSQFAAQPELVQGMKSALADTEYQGVQTQLIQDWVKREVKLGMDMGLKGEKELAVFVDVANQYGQGKANQIAGIGRGEGDQGAEMNAAARGGKYAERMARIDSTFSTQTANLEVNGPAYDGTWASRFVSAIKDVDARMSGTGWCARAVQTALANVGLKQFLGSGDAWNMLGPLQRSGLFQRVSEAEAKPGDIILRPPSANPNDDSRYGDISVVSARRGDTIIQTNDATYQFERNNPRYDGKAVFLRYSGGSSESQVATGSTASGEGDAPRTRRRGS